MNIYLISIKYDLFIIHYIVYYYIYLKIIYLFIR